MPFGPAPGGRLRRSCFTDDIHGCGRAFRSRPEKNPGSALVSLELFLLTRTRPSFGVHSRCVRTVEDRRRMLLADPRAPRDAARSFVSEHFRMAGKGRGPSTVHVGHGRPMDLRDVTGPLWRVCSHGKITALLRISNLKTTFQFDGDLPWLHFELRAGRVFVGLAFACSSTKLLGGFPCRRPGYSTLKFGGRGRRRPFPFDQAWTRRVTRARPGTVEARSISFESS